MGATLRAGTPRNRSRSKSGCPRPRGSPLPELAEVLAPLRVQFLPGPSAETLRQDVRGLLSEHPTKNGDTLAGIVLETSEQPLQYLLTDMVWDELALNRQRSAPRLPLPSAGDGMLSFDETGFEKKGRHSGEVVWQYTGTVGKITNCQGQLSLGGTHAGVAGGDAVVSARRGAADEE